MTTSNILFFAEKLKARKEKELEEKKSKEKSSGETQVGKTSVITEEVVAKLIEEIERQKENVDIWLDALDDFFDECETNNDLINFLNCLSVYFIESLNMIVDSKEEPCNKDLAEIIALAICENQKSLAILHKKLQLIINKGK